MTTLPALDPARAVVLAAVAKAMGRPRLNGPTAAHGRLLGARGATLAAAVDANRSILGSPTRPAIERYSGVLYDELGYGRMRAGARRRFDAQALIFNALTGVVAPRDPLPEHRLELGASLPKLGRLATWWRPQLTEALSGRLEGAVVWDLLPNEHAAAWSPHAVATGRRITVRFVDAEGRTLSHWNKLLKGALARFIVESGAVDLSALASFAHPTGYRFIASATEHEERVTRVVFAGGS